jgi:hypothetical protein
MAFDLSDYKDVAERLADLKQVFPDATIQTEVVDLPAGFAGSYLAVQATLYRWADDRAPAKAMAWEPVPGLTPYTKNSELQNAETSAWGRVIIAAQASSSKHVASRQEVEPRQIERDVPDRDSFDADGFFKLATKALREWDEERRRDAFAVAVAANKPGKPMTKMEAEKVWADMSSAYYAEHPGTQQELT